MKKLVETVDECLCSVTVPETAEAAVQLSPPPCEATVVKSGAPPPPPPPPPPPTEMQVEQPAEVEEPAPMPPPPPPPTEVSVEGEQEGAPTET